MVTYGVLIWSMVAAFMFGGAFGIAILSLMVVAKDKTETRKEDKTDEKE